MTYSIIVKAKLLYLWTTYLCSIFASLLRFHQTISVESINSIVLCSFYPKFDTQYFFSSIFMVSTVANKLIFNKRILRF